MWGYMDHYGWGGMGIGMLLFWGLLVAAIVVVARGVCGSASCSKHKPEKSAMDILKERYARGEIEREEFEQKRRDLDSE